MYIPFVYAYTCTNTITLAATFSHMNFKWSQIGGDDHHLNDREDKALLDFCISNRSVLISYQWNFSIKFNRIWNNEPKARACMLFTMLFAAVVVVDVDDQFNRSFYSFFSFLSLREFTLSRTPSSHPFILQLCLGCYLWWRLAPKHDIEHYYAFPIQLIFNLFGKKHWATESMVRFASIST